MTVETKKEEVEGVESPVAVDYKPIDICIVNMTKVKLLFTNMRHTHGTDGKISGPNPIPPEGGQSTFHAENVGAIGAEGTFDLALQDGSKRAFTCSYSHPYGSGTTTVSWTSPPNCYVERQVDDLQHHKAYCKDACHCEC